MDENAEAQVEAFLGILQRRYGMSEDELDRVLRYLILLSGRAERAKTYGDWAAKATITLVVTSFLAGVGLAVLHMLKEIFSK